jgi:hypothetical protein
LPSFGIVNLARPRLMALKFVIEHAILLQSENELTI